MNSPDNFKDILRRKFSELEELPPENDWEVFKSKYDFKRSRISLYRKIAIIGVIVMVAVVTTLIVLYKNNDHKAIHEQILLKEVHQPKNQDRFNEKTSQVGSVVNSGQNEVHRNKKIAEEPKVAIPTLNTYLKPEKTVKKIADSTSNMSTSGVMNEQKPGTLVKLLSDKEKVETTKPLPKPNQNKILNDNETENASQPENDVDNTDSILDTYTNIQSDKSDGSNPVPGGDVIRLDVVNVITPNGDGINDKLVFKNIDQFGTCSINIYNSWGEKIYTSSNYQNNWDGRCKGKLVDEGTYYYVLETNEGKVFKGAVNILK